MCVCMLHARKPLPRHPRRAELHLPPRRGELAARMAEFAQKSCRTRASRVAWCASVYCAESLCVSARESAIHSGSTAARQHHCSRCALHTEHVGPDELPAPRAYARPAREERCACAYVHGCLLSCCADFLMPWLARRRPADQQGWGLFVAAGDTELQQPPSWRAR